MYCISEAFYSSPPKCWLFIPRSLPLGWRCRPSGLPRLVLGLPERARGAGRPPAAPGVSLARCRRFPPPVEGSRIELPGKVRRPKIQWLSPPSIIIINRTVCFRHSSCWRTSERAAGAEQGQGAMRQNRGQRGARPHSSSGLQSIVAAGTGVVVVLVVVLRCGGLRCEAQAISPQVTPWGPSPRAAGAGSKHQDGPGSRGVP